ncbi:polyprenyl synthetase family protein [Enterococcus faecalis]
MNTFWKSFPDLEHSLTETCDLIEQRLHTRNQDIEKALVTLAHSGGKLLRPAFFFLFAQLGDKKQQDRQQLVKIAASLEILHMATLIHDDIIDDSPLRRNAITIQAQYGKDVAVYTGDLLFTDFFSLIAEAMNGSHFMQINARSMKRLLLGELDQMSHRFDRKMSVLDYLRNIEGKTAELFSLSCLEGAHFGKSAPEIQRLAKRIGRHIGIAFQVYDDILDYTADAKTLKKPALEDLAQGVYTLPLLFAYRHAPTSFSLYLDKGKKLSLEEATTVAALVHEHHGIKEAQAFAKKVTNKAIDDIQQLPAGQAKLTLLSLTKLLLHRSF